MFGPSASSRMTAIFEGWESLIKEKSAKIEELEAEVKRVNLCWVEAMNQIQRYKDRS